MDGSHDLETRADVVRLVDGFYARVRVDAVLGPIFNDVARTDWDAHLPRMYDFWERVLFGTGSFQGNPLGVHRVLARRVALGDREFERWLALFHETVDGAFHGPQAEEAKARASRIAGVMQYHIATDADATMPSGGPPQSRQP